MGQHARSQDASPAAKRKAKAVLGIWKTQQEHCACVHVCVRRRVGADVHGVCVCACGAGWARACGCVCLCVCGAGWVRMCGV